MCLDGHLQFHVSSIDCGLQLGDLFLLLIDADSECFDLGFVFLTNNLSLLHFSFKTVQILSTDLEEKNDLLDHLRKSLCDAESNLQLRIEQLEGEVQEREIVRQ